MYSVVIVTFSNLRKRFLKLNSIYCHRVSRSFAENCDGIKFNYHPECEEQISLQINQELYASYAYLSLAYHFEHPAISLPGFFHMFLFFSKEETGHAQKLIEFQNKRGGNVCYTKIEPLKCADWTPLSAVEKAIELEKSVTRNMHILHQKGAKHNDAHLCDFVESEYLTEQYKAIRELFSLRTTIMRINEGLGIYILDKNLKREFENKKI